MIDMEVLRAMVAEGASAETVVRVVGMMVARDEARRAQWRESQANTRAKRAATAAPQPSQQTVNRQSTDAAYIESKKVSKKEKKIYIPADFALNEADLAACREAGWIDAKIATELVRFKDHAAQNGRQCVDWHAAWRSWVRSPFQTQTKPGGMNGHHVAAKPNVSDVLRGMAEETRRREGADFGGLLPKV